MSENIWEYFELLKKYRNFIFTSTISVTIVSTIIAFLLPLWYFSFAVIKPIEEKGSNLFSAMLGNKGLSSIGKNLNIGGLQYSDIEYFKSLLSSRKIALDMITKFDLKEVYDQKYTFKTIDMLIDNSDIQINSKSNLLTIGVYDRNPNRAKEMVEYYLNLLEMNLREFQSSRSILEIEHIEKRYIKNREDLKVAEQNLKDFQEKYRVILPEEQFIGTVKLIGELSAQKLLLETQLSSAISSHGEKSPLVKDLREQMNILETKIFSLKSHENNSDLELNISFKNAPHLIQKYIELYREVEIQSKLLEFIYPIFEQLKLEETKDISAFITIDQAFVPEYKARPKRIIIIIGGLIFSSIFSVLGVILFEYISLSKKNYH